MMEHSDPYEKTTINEKKTQFTTGYHENYNSDHGLIYKSPEK